LSQTAPSSAKEASRHEHARQDTVRASARPSAARAAAAARLVGHDKLSEALNPQRVGDGVRHLRVVEPRKLTAAERRRRARLLLAGGLGVFVAVVFGLVYMHVVLAQRQFAIDRLDSKVQAQQAQYQNLRLLVAQLGAPQNIIATAEGQLGMVQPASVSYLTPKQTIGSSPGTSNGTSNGTSSGVSGASSGQLSSSPQAPAGDADWPKIKSQLAGSP
jgi:cell division protein FtsL